MRTIYTAIFGNYDELKQPTIITPGWSYVCFTDQYPVGKIGAWEIINVNVSKGYEQITARWFKITPPWMNPHHINYNDNLETMWIDASFTINCNLDRWWKENYKGPFTCISHPIRQDVYEEATVCIRHKRGAEDDILPQITRYEEMGMPANGGLISSGILMRNNTKEVREFCQAWWEELVKGPSLRDQLAFAFVEWQRGILRHTIKWDYRSRQEFQFLQHIHRRRKLPTNNPINQ